MVSLIEAEEGDIGNLDQVRKDLRDAVAERATDDERDVEAGKEAPAQKRKRTIEVDDDELPEQLRGKDVKDLVQIIRDSQSTIGRMANDLGTQRQLTDRILNLKRELDLRENVADEKPPKLDFNDVVDNPGEAIDKIVAARLARQRAEDSERLQALEAQLVQRDFVARHPDYTDIAADPEFGQWVRATPYRAKVADRAANGDYTAADDLLTEYKELRKMRQQAINKNEEHEEAENLKAARAASLERAGGSNAAKKGGRQYRRADLLKLQMEDPDSYYDEAFQAEIIRAYSEGRVK